MRRARFIALLLVVAGCILTLPPCGGTSEGPSRPMRVKTTPFVQRNLRIDGIRVRYIDEGAGVPVLLVPGHTSRIEEYDAVTAALRGSHRVLVFDFPGSGYSDKPDRTYDLAFYDRAIIAFLDAVGVDRCVIAGGSLGGNLALRAAAAHPDRFLAVAAWGPGSAWERKPVMAAFARHFGYVPFLISVRIQSRYWYAKDWPGKDEAVRGAFAYYDEVMSPGFVRMYWGLAADQMDTSLFDIAADIRRPVLLMVGDRDDGFAMYAGVKRLHALMPDAKLVVFRDAGHSLVCERTGALIGELQEFLAGTTDAH